MSSGVTLAEARLIHAYRSAADAPEKAAIVRCYGEITRLSMGRAEDALDLWAHLLNIAQESTQRLAIPRTFDRTSSSGQCVRPARSAQI